MKTNDDRDRPKLTTSEQGWLDEISAITKLIRESSDRENAADDAAYALARRYYRPKENAFKPRFERFLAKMKFKTRSSRDNKLLPIIDLTHAPLTPPTRTRRAQFIAAALHFRQKPSELRREEGREKHAVRVWKEATGRVRPKRTPAAQPPEPKEPRRIEIIDGDVNLEEIESGKRYVGIFSVVDPKSGETHLHCYLDATLPDRAARVAEMLIDETGDNLPTPKGTAAAIMRELDRRYGVNSPSMLKLDCAAGRAPGVFYSLMTPPKLWCEVQRCVDFLVYEGPHVDWVITNPMWGARHLRQFLIKAFEVSDNVAFLLQAGAAEGLIKTNNLIDGSGFSLRTKLRLPEQVFPNLGGWQVALYHWQRGYAGQVDSGVLEVPPE